MNTIPEPPCHLITVDEAPEPFRHILQERLTEPAEMLFYHPALASVRRPHASLLAVTGAGWTVLEQAADGEVTAQSASYGDTLLAELTTILLYGSLRLDYLAKGNLQGALVEFHASRAGDYEDVVNRMLGSIDSRPGHHVRQSQLGAQLDGLPLRFHHAALAHMPVGRQLISVVHWPACVGGHHRWFPEELAPEATLLLTDCELILLSDERARSWLRLGRAIPQYGTILTYLPLLRLGNCRLDVKREEPLAVLELDLRTADGDAADALRVGFPHEMADELAGFLEEVARQRDHSSSRF